MIVLFQYARQQAGTGDSNESPAAAVAQRNDDPNDVSVEEANVENVESAAGAESQVSGLRDFLSLAGISELNTEHSPNALTEGTVSVEGFNI